MCLWVSLEGAQGRVRKTWLANPVCTILANYLIFHLFIQQHSWANVLGAGFIRINETVQALLFVSWLGVRGGGVIPNEPQFPCLYNVLQVEIHLLCPEHLLSARTRLTDVRVAHWILTTSPWSRYTNLKLLRLEIQEAPSSRSQSRERSH